MRFHLPGKGVSRAAGQAGPEDFYQGPGMGDEAGSDADQGIATADDSKKRIVKANEEIDEVKSKSVEQSGIELSYPSKIGSVSFVVLGVAPVDETKHAGVGDDHLMTEPRKEATGPVRVGAGFDDLSVFHKLNRNIGIIYFCRFNR